MSMLNLEFDGENFLVPSTTLWHYVSKEHLDRENKLSVDEWLEFLYANEDAFEEECKLLGQKLFSDFINSKLKEVK